MTKRSVIRMMLSVALIIYLSVAMYCAVKAEARAPYASLQINVEQTGETPFVTAADIDARLGGLQQRIGAVPRDSVNTLSIEERLRAFDNIEHVNCVVLNNGVVRLDVTPLIPVARVFASNGGTYYINHGGKIMMASPQLRSSVPVISGHFGQKVHPADLIPMLDYMQAHPDRQQLVSQIDIAPNGDIMLIPMISGHVVNFGDTADVANKFDRLETFYRKVMPVKGWQYYDTISVKWRGQVVAKKRVNTPKNNFIPIDEHSDIDDDETMTVPTDGTNA